MKTNYIFSALTLSSVFMITPLSVYADKGDTGGTGGVAGMEISTLSSFALSVQVSYDGMSFLANFRSNMGMIDVWVQDANGFTVYTGLADTSVSRQHYIDAFGFSPGAYTLYFSDAKGRIIHNTTMMVD